MTNKEQLDANNARITELTNRLASKAAGMENPMTTAGDIIIGGENGTPTRLGIGTEGQVLKVGANGLEYGEAGSGGEKKYLHHIRLVIGAYTGSVIMEFICDQSSAFTNYDTLISYMYNNRNSTSCGTRPLVNGYTFSANSGTKIVQYAELVAQNDFRLYTLRVYVDSASAEAPYTESDVVFLTSVSNMTDIVTAL